MTGLNRETLSADVCVIGGGLAGLCAAIAAARNGAKTVLVHERPMFGGNASSEVRMWVCGAHGEHNKETGILEEIQLANLHRNAGLNYPMWDGVLYEKAFYQPGLTPLLNTSCTDAKVEDGRIVSIAAWQLTSQTWFTIDADVFIDCSGDSILAAVTPAAHRVGRESSEEFGEDIEPAAADARTMGNSLLIQTHRCDEPQPFVPPKWAYRFEKPEDLAFRVNGVSTHNFWWLEVGGIHDTIRDAERIRDELMRISYGVWDYLKNRAPEREKAANWAIHWVGALPGKRESRRYEGAYMMRQRDVEAGGAFADTIAYGGWSMDDHHPAGLLYPGKPTIFHPAPSPYGIPYRSLYSRNVSNLMFAGRNISVTHAALSSTRVMATCAVIGQAAGTAAAICTRHRCEPQGIYEHHLKELQQTLMCDDCFLPGFTRQIDGLSLAAKLSGQGDGAERLWDGIDRDRPGAQHAWEGRPGASALIQWAHAVQVGGVRVIFDSNLNHDKRMPCAYPVKGSRCAMPGSLVRAFKLEAMDDAGAWRTVYREKENMQRLIEISIEANAKALRLTPEETWGDEAARVFAFEATADHCVKVPRIAQGPRFADVRAAVDEADLTLPAKEQAGRSSGASA